MKDNLPLWQEYRCKIYGTPCYNFPLVNHLENYTWIQNILNSLYTLGLSMILNELQMNPLIMQDCDNKLLKKIELKQWKRLNNYPIRLDVLYSLHKVSLERRNIFLKIIKLIYSEWNSILSKDLLFNEIKLCFI